MSLTEATLQHSTETDHAEEASAFAPGRIASRGIDGEVVARLIKGGDATAIVTVGVVSLATLLPSLDRFDLMACTLIIVFAMFCHLLVVREAGGYKPSRLLRPLLAIGSTALGSAVAVLASLAATVAIFGPETDVWPWLAAWWGAALFFVVAGRLGAATVLHKCDCAGRLSHRIAIVGSGDEAAKVIGRLGSSNDRDLDVVGFFDDRWDERAPADMMGCPHLGSVDDLVEFARWFRIDTIIVTLPMVAEERLYGLLKRLWVVPADIRISTLGSPVRLSRRTYSYLGSVPLLAAFDRPLSQWGQLTKSVFDRVVAAFALVALAPVFAATALAVRLESKGSVFFRQPRYGFNNQLIEVYKFRSMFADRGDQHANRLVTKNDDRVTRVGRFIRKTSIDELPQLINVLKGELSLVGPRPHAVKARAADRLYDDVVDGYFARHRVKPGVTGWAQINGWRGETDTREKIERRVEHDLYYIDNWSMWLDISILARTPFALLNTQNAY